MKKRRKDRKNGRNAEVFIHQRDRYTHYERAKTNELNEREAAVESKEMRLRSMRLEVRDQRKKEVEMRLDKQKLEEELEEVKARLQELQEERDQVMKREKDLAEVKRDWEKKLEAEEEKIVQKTRNPNIGEAKVSRGVDKDVSSPKNLEVGVRRR